MKLKTLVCFILILFCCLSLGASVFSSRNSILQRLIEPRQEVEEEESAASQVPDVRAKAPKIYGKKKTEPSALPEDVPAEEETLEETEPVIAIEEEILPEPVVEEEIPSGPVIVIETEPEEVFVVIKEQEPEPVAVPVPQPRLSPMAVRMAMLLCSMAVAVSLSFSFRGVSGPLQAKLALLAAALTALVPMGLSVLAAGWCWLWLGYAMLFATFFIFKARRSFR